jgi:hypothetical protein
MSAARPYKMSFSTGGLFVNESIEVARIYDCTCDWPETIAKALADRATSLPKSASNRRTLREIVNRVSCMKADELRFLIERADRPEQEALLWLATCRAYRFVREFATEVIGERFLSYRLALPLESFDQFFDAKAEWDEGLAKISQSTRRKLRQILFRILREAGVIDSANNIRAAHLSSRLKNLLAQSDPNDLSVFPGIRP